MKIIALVHTVKTVADTFEHKIRAGVSEPVKIYNLLDDFLALHPNEVGEFTITNKNRLYNDLKNAELTGADIIVVTCSTLTPVVEDLRPFFKVPIIAIDDAMGRKAVESGRRIAVMATARSTVLPTMNKIKREAQGIGKEVILSEEVVQEAFQAMKTGDMVTHDRLLLQRTAEIKDVDCVVLAQASMAHLRDEIEALIKVPVLASPDLCVEEIKEKLNEI